MLPRVPCPECDRTIAVTQIARPRLYRHDPPTRDPELRSCSGSFECVQLDTGQQLLFTDAAGEDGMIPLF